MVNSGILQADSIFLELAILRKSLAFSENRLQLHSGTNKDTYLMVELQVLDGRIQDGKMGECCLA
jgi:hypothetical protein